MIRQSPNAPCTSVSSNEGSANAGGAVDSRAVAQDGSASFIVNGAAVTPDAALTTASAEVMLTSGLSFALSYEGEFSQLTRSHAGKGVVCFTW